MEEDIKIEVANASFEKAILFVEGYINLNTSDDLRRIIQSIQDEHNPKIFIFDLHGVEYVSSAGIGVFMSTYESIEKLKGKIALVGMTDDIRRVFELLGFLEYFEDCKTMNDTAKIS